jgi:hypothetical protein
MDRGKLALAGEETIGAGKGFPPSVAAEPVAAPNFKKMALNWRGNKAGEHRIFLLILNRVAVLRSL